MTELKQQTYSTWRTEALETELKFLYIEIGRREQDASDNINNIRQIEAELVSRRIKKIATSEDIERADIKQVELPITTETVKLIKENEKYHKLLEELQSLYANKKERTGLTAFEVGIAESVNKSLS